MAILYVQTRSAGLVERAPVHFTHPIRSGIQLDAQRLIAIPDGDAAPLPGHRCVCSVDRYHRQESAALRISGLPRQVVLRRLVSVQMLRDAIVRVHAVPVCERERKVIRLGQQTDLQR